jgi:hypothetical protein
MWIRQTPAVILTALGLSALATATAFGTHPRPRGATPLKASLAVAYRQCDDSFPNGGGPNRQHGGSLNVLSCNPPLQRSNWVTVGTGDAWPGTTPNLVGSIRFDVKASSPENVIIRASVTDVRCDDSTACGAENGAPDPRASLSDYTGGLTAVTVVRSTDHYNKPIPGSATASSTSFPIENANDPATLQDLVQPIPMTCAETPTDTTIGSTCTFDTTMSATMLAVPDGKRQNLELRTIEVQDGGLDGDPSTNDGQQVFLTQGLFVP